MDLVSGKSSSSSNHHVMHFRGSPVITEDGKYIHLFPQEGTSSTPWFFAELELPITKEIQFKTVFAEATNEFFFVTNDDNLVYIRTNKDAPKFRLVRVDLNNPGVDNWVNILPEDKDSVLNGAVAINNDSLVAIYLRDVVHIIQIHNLVDGKYLWDADTPVGTISGMTGRREDSVLFYRITSYLLPGIIYKYDFGTNPHTITVSNDPFLQLDPLNLI